MSVTHVFVEIDKLQVCQPLEVCHTFVADLRMAEIEVDQIRQSPEVRHSFDRLRVCRRAPRNFRRFNPLSCARPASVTCVWLRYRCSRFVRPFRCDEIGIAVHHPAVERHEPDFLEDRHAIIAH